METTPSAIARIWVRFIARRAYGRQRRRRITCGGDFRATKWRDCESPARGTAFRRPTPRITARMGRWRRFWSERVGLRGRMAASYVLVTAAAVIVVEAIAIAFTIPSLLANQDLVTRVRYTAQAYADAASSASTSSTQLVLPSGFVLGQPDSSLGPGKVKAQAYGLEIPQITTAYPDGGPPLSLALILSPDGHVIATSYPARYPVGGDAFGVLPYGPKSVRLGENGQISEVPTGQVAWVVVPVVQAGGKPLGSVKNLNAYVYVQAPVQAQTIASFTAAQPL